MPESGALQFIGGLVTSYLLWTFLVYWMHRASHVERAWNPLWKLHQAHHDTPYISYSRYRFKPGYLVFWFGSWRATLDVLLCITLPLAVAVALLPDYAIWLVPIHYVYEAFLSEGLVDHNPNIRGRVTRILAIGIYHLRHHGTRNFNYSLFVTLWDHVFGTHATRTRNPVPKPE